MTDTPKKEEFRVPVNLFDLGRIVATQGALAACSPEYMAQCLGRHVRGYWGCIDAEDRKTNFDAMFSGERILSAYPIDPAKPCEGFGACRRAPMCTESNSPRRFHGRPST